MVRFQPLFLALCLGLTTTASLAATNMNGTDTHPRADHSSGEQPYDNTRGQGNSVNDPDSTRDNDSSDTNPSSDVPDGTTGGSNNTGEATGTGAGASGGSAEDQDSR